MAPRSRTRDAPGRKSGGESRKAAVRSGETASGAVRQSSASPLAEDKGRHLAKPGPKTPPDPAKPKANMSEGVLFTDPYASLD